MRSQMEVPGEEVPTLGHLAPRHSAVNSLTPAQVNQLVAHFRAAGRLANFTVETGGRQPVTVLRSSWAAAGEAQVGLPAGPAFNAIRQTLIDEGWLEAQQPSNAVNLNVGELLWRYNHDGRLFPLGAEVSHLASAYHSNLPSGHKVELSEAESRDVNESRKYCAKFGLMWIHQDGTPFAADERHGQPGFQAIAGQPTMCPHSALGSPCYGPFIPIERVPTFLTPARVKVTGGRKRKGGEKSPKPGKGAKAGQAPSTPVSLAKA